MPTQNHHYVPRTYFKPWEDSSRKILVYERKGEIVFPPYLQSTKKICCVPNLYSYTSSMPVEKQNVIEEYAFKTIDNAAAKILTKILQRDFSEPTEIERTNFSIFLLSLRMRTPEFFSSISQSAEQKLRLSISESDNDPSLEDLKRKMEGRSFLSYAEEKFPHVLENKGKEILSLNLFNEKIFSKFYQLNWAIFWNSEEILVTSDRPLILIPGSEKKSIHVLALPLSPYCLFVASDKIETLKKLEKLNRKKLFQEANVSVIQQAHSKAFSKTCCHSLRFFENRLAKNHGILPFAEVA